MCPQKFSKISGKTFENFIWTKNIFSRWIFDENFYFLKIKKIEIQGFQMSRLRGANYNSSRSNLCARAPQRLVRADRPGVQFSSGRGFRFLSLSSPYTVPYHVSETRIFFYFSYTYKASPYHFIPDSEHVPTIFDHSNQKASVRPCLLGCPAQMAPSPVEEAVPRPSMSTMRTPAIKSTSWDLQLDNPNNFKR